MNVLNLVKNCILAILLLMLLILSGIVIFSKLGIVCFVFVIVSIILAIAYKVLEWVINKQVIK